MSKDYALLIDYEYCSGCHSCEIACKNEREIPHGQWGIKVLEDEPWQLDDGSWHWNYIPVPSELCNLCVDRIEQNLEPSCVQHCQAKVLEFGTPEELAKKMSAKQKTVIFRP